MEPTEVCARLSLVIGRESEVLNVKMYSQVREPCSKTCSIDSASERKITNVSNARHEITSEWQELQQLHSALDRAQQEVMSLDQKLCQARRNLEEEKRKRRIAEQERDLLVYCFFFCK